MNADTAVARENRAVGRLEKVVRTNELAVAIKAGYPKINGIRAFEGAVPPVRQSPQAIDIPRRDRVIRTPKGFIRTDPEIRAAYQHG